MDFTLANDIATVHQYIIQNDLLNLVELRAKQEWSAGSRTSYYNAVKKAANGDNTGLSLVERIMLKVACQLKAEREAIPA